MVKRYAQAAPVRNPATGKWRLSALPLTERSYLGGLTFPYLTRRPHMGPFNRVSDKSISAADEVYRRHDKAYASYLSPYTNFNKADQALLDAPSTGWADYVAKGVFGAKKALDLYNVPTLYRGGLKSPLKSVSSIPLPKDGSRPGKGIRDYMDNPTIPKGGFTTVQEISSGDITGVEPGPRNFWRNRDFSTSVPHAHRSGKFNSKIRYEY
jgi:hypothetical protein